MTRSQPRVSPEGDGDATPVHEQVSAQARRAPDATAVRAPDATLSYGDLERRSNRLAHHLRALGVRRETPVGLCVERSAALVVGALGIMKAGGAYVALDPGHPPERLGFMLDDCGAEVILTGRGTEGRLAGTRARTVLVDAPDEAPAGQPDTPPAVGAGGRDLAYVIYTSGSTGVPKGVEIAHGSLAGLVRWHREAFAVTERDRATQFASPGFDAAVWELWPHLCAGASLHVAEAGIRRDPAAIRDWLVGERITLSFLPTALAEMVMTLAWPGETALRYLLTGGDTLHRRPPPGLPFAVINNYGPSEATVVSTSGVVAPDPQDGPPPSIGRPIPGVATYVVDEHLDEVPTGTVGELLIGGPAVARGYRGRPELTAERFIPDRFGAAPGARLYRTGDHVRRRPDGELEFHGRDDDQLQIRGNRVEPGEISAVLNRHPALRAAVVVAAASPGETRLVAYVVPGAAPPASEELRDHVAAHLPDFMVPAAFVTVDALPLTTSGKLDRGRLPLPTPAAPVDPVRPRDELERALERIVAELLERDEVGVDANFFMLGGHSLLGAQLITRIGGRFGVDMSLRSLFENPTIAEMALEVKRLLVSEIMAMSDADAARLLIAEAADPSAPAASAGPPGPVP